MFSRIASGYDLANHLLSFGFDRRWRNYAVKHLHFSQQPMLLDLCAGTGDFTLALLKRFPDGGGVAVDFSRPMLELARKKLNPKIETLEMDASQLAFQDESFDVALCGFGLRNVVELESALRECHRTLKPGGKFIILEFMGGQKGLIYKCFMPIFHFIAPLVGGIISRNRKAYQYLQQSMLSYYSPDELTAKLTEAGFKVAKVENLNWGIVTFFLAKKP